ncbi:hypothetical protein [Sporosarcina sp. FSL K6-5500]|uniref:hypothetical protein n=1 Tax=Sporosarcina sp. FSL K6-5500 TaxID=2921558 RepID=UPI0030F5D794
MAEQPSNVVLNFQMNGQVQYAQTLTQINMVMQTAAKEYANHVAAMGRDATMTEKLIAEKQKLETQMNASTEKVRMLRAEYDAMSADTNTTAAELQKLYNQLLSAETAHSRLEQSMQRVNEGLTDEAIAAREAQGALRELQASGRSLEAEQRNVISAFELEAAQLGANATEAQKLELAQRRLAAQTSLAGRAVSILEDQLDQARTAYGDNSDEVVRLETQLNNARTTLHQFGDDLSDIPDDAEAAEDSVGDLGGAFQALGGIVAGLGLGAIIAAALAEADIASTIDITFNVPEESKEAVRSSLSDIKKYGVDGEAALEGMRRQWALNKDATDDMNSSVVEGSAALTRMYTSLDFVDVIQEVNNISKVLGSTNEEALDLIYNLINVGLPPEQISVIAEFGNQFQRMGYTVKEVQGLIASAVSTGSSDVTGLLDGLKEGIVKAREFSLGISDAMKDSIRAIKGGVEKASEGQLAAMQEGFAKQETALSKSIASRSKAVSKGHDQQKNALSKSLDAQYKAVSKGYDNQAKALEKSLSASYDKSVKKYDNQQKALDKSLETEYKAVSKSHDDQHKVLEKSLSTNYDKVTKNYEAQQKALEKNLELEVEAFEKASEQKMKLIDAEYYARLKLVDEERYNQLKSLDSQIDALDARTTAEDRAIKQREDAEKRVELQKRIAIAATSEERAEALKALRDFEEKLRLDVIREERKVQTDALKQQKETVKEISDTRKEALKEEIDGKKEATKEQSDIEKKALKERQDDKKEISKQEIKDALDALSEENKAELESLKVMLAAKREVLKEEQDAQKEALKEQNTLSLAAISEANKARMEAAKESSSANLEALKEEQDQRKSALSERLSNEADAVRESHAAEMESFKKMNAEKLELAKNPPDTAEIQAVFDELEGWGAAVAKGGPEGTQAFEDMVRWLDSIEDATLRNALGVEVFGSKWEDEGDKLIDTLLNGENALAEMEKAQKDFNKTMGELDNTPTVKIKEAFEELMEALSPLLLKVAEVVGVFANFAAENSGLTSIIVGLAAVITIAAGAFAFFAPLVAAIPALLPAITGALVPLTKAFGFLVGLIPKLGLVFTALTGPIGIAVAAIAAIAAIAFVVIKNWEPISNFFKKLWDGIWGTIKSVGTSILNFLRENWKTILAVITGPLGLAVKFVLENFGKIKDTTLNILGLLAKKITEIWLGIEKSISKPITLAKNTVDGAIKAIKGFFSSLTLKFPKLNTDMFENARKAVKKAIDAIKGFFNFEFKWPKLKMPEFKVEGTMNPLKWIDEGVPKFDIKWNAKGAIFQQPTIFGASNGQLQGAGEAGPEAVLPLNAKTLGDIGKGIVDAMGGNFGGGDTNLTVELDGEVIARKTIKYTARELLAKQDQKRKGRGKG